MIVIEHDGSIFYGGVSLEQGFIVDNKVFAVDEGGVESFFNNSGKTKNTTQDLLIIMTSLLPKVL